MNVQGEFGVKDKKIQANCLMHVKVDFKLI